MKECDKWRNQALLTNEKVAILLKGLEESGCPFEKFIHCQDCSQRTFGYFNPSKGIVLCENNLKHPKQLEQTLTHELVHAYDYCRYQFDEANPKHHACSEVRAMHLGEDCSLLREFFRGYWHIKKQFEQCVKRRAALSLVANPVVESKEQATNIVESVYGECIGMIEPFTKSDYERLYK